MSETKALRWVKASEGLPELPNSLPPNTPEERGILFINRVHSAANFWYPSYGFPAKDFFIPFSNKTLYGDGWGIENWEWLDESGCIPNRVRKTELFEHALKLAQNYERDHPSAGIPILSAPPKEKEEAGIPEEIRQEINKMWVHDPHRHDLANYEAGAIAMYHKLQAWEIKLHDGWNGIANELNNEIEALQSQLSTITEERDEARKERDDAVTNQIFSESINTGFKTALQDSNENLRAEQDAAIKEVGEYRKIHQEIEERHTYLRAEENKAINELDGNAPGSIERQAKWTFIREMCGRRNELWAWLNKLPAQKKEEHP